MTPPSTPHFPVVIVGAGPTGLTLANLLAGYGVRHLLVERNLATVQEPRAVSIDDESLRTMQAAGVIESVLTEVVPGYGSIYYSRSGKAFAKVHPTGTPYGYPRRNAFRQPVLEAQLLTALESKPASSRLFGWQLKKFTQLNGHVNVTIENAEGETQQIGCTYLIGCDGASSTVRTLLDIALEGLTYAKRWLIVDLENNENRTEHTEVFCDPRRPCIVLPGPRRTRRYEFEMLPHETDADMLDPEQMHRLLARYGADPQATIRRKTVYRFHARVAPRWSVGRVFLAGDAAHLTPPFAGQGMNSGVRDAHNLAWKLAAVTSGVFGPGLLATYEQERRDHAWQMIRLALQMGRVMSPANAVTAALTRATFALLNLWPPAREYIAQMRYKPKPRFTDGFMLADGRNAQQTLVGRLLPQPYVLTTDGRRVLLDDVLGHRFSLLVRTATPDRALNALNQAVWDRMNVRRVFLLPSDASAHILHRATCVLETDRNFANLLGDDHSHAFLLRPDRYVAACFPLDRADQIAHQIDRLMQRTWDSSVPANAEPAPEALIE